MAVVRVKMIGSGRQGDSYRAPLPTYQELLTDYDARTVLVLIPDTDLHDDPKKVDDKGHKTSAGHHVLTLDKGGHKAWHAHLDKKYSERKGEFRPEIV